MLLSGAQPHEADFVDVLFLRVTRRVRTVGPDQSVKQLVEIAVLEKIPSYGPSFSAELKAAEEVPCPGDQVTGFGYPLRFGESLHVAVGSVVGLGKSNEVHASIWTYFGSSGGPLLNAKGEVVGICSCERHKLAVHVSACQFRQLLKTCV